MRKVTTLFLLIGLFALGYAAYSFYDTRSFLTRAQKVEAEVVKVDLKITEHKESATKKVYHPYFRFKTFTGESITFRSPHGTNELPAYKVGDKVELLYLPEKPQDARVNNTFGLWGWTIISGVTGLVLTIVAGRARKRYRGVL